MYYNINDFISATLRRSGCAPGRKKKGPKSKKEGVCCSWACASGKFFRCCYSGEEGGTCEPRVDPEEFAKDMAKPKGLYFDSEIDAGAKASLELVRKAVDGDGTMMLSNPVFIDAYVATVGKAVGDVVTPATSLRTHVASSDTELEVSADRMGRKIRASSIYGFTPADEKAVKFFKAYPTMNATLFATPKSIAGDKALLQLIPKQHRKEVQREARKKAPFIYAAPRSNKSWLYIFVADDVKTADELVATFVDLSKARVGVLQP